MFEVRFHNVALVAFATALFATGCDDDNDLDDIEPPPPGEVPPSETPSVSGFRVTSLVTNQTDPDLINPWGLCGARGLFWIADNGTGKVSVYDGTGTPSPDHPTGQLSLREGITGVSCVPQANDTNVFVIPCDGQLLGPAELVFASEDGFLIAVNDQTPAEGVRVVDRSAVGANYKGVTRVNMERGPVLLAADFVNARVDMFDSSFKLITPAAGAAAPFNDPQLPAGWGPFNVQTRNDHVYVMEAKVGEEGDEEKGAGLGAVAIFDVNGTLVARLTSNSFNAPWGVDIAPSSSTLTQGIPTLFIGNFGDGRVTAFDAGNLRELGQLTDTSGNVIAIDGLWGLEIGTAAAGSTNAIYFAAGPADETAGLYGRIEHVTE
jgi:uncharacterized protein (TIGR03118 family)